MMEKEMKKVPAVRFKGFTDDWEQRKLGDFADVSKLAGFEFTKYVTYSDTGNIIALRGLNVKKGKLVLDDVKYIDNSDFSKLSRSKLYSNDILFTYVGTIGELAIIHDDNRFYLAPNVARIRIIDKTDSEFIVQLMESDEFYRYMILPLIASSSQPALSMENIRKFELNLPLNLDEQKQVGIFFAYLDKNITLHQRKSDQLKKVKAYFLQNLFPAKGEKVPKIRFKGFTGPWEQRKLGEILTTIPFKSYLKKPEFDGKYEIIQQGNNPIIGYANGNPCTDYENIVIFGDHTLSLYKPESPFFVATDGVRILKGVNEMNGYYLEVLLERNRPKNEGYKRYYSILADEECYISVSREEQCKIGVFFHYIDNAITLHQRKLEELQTLKKFLLQNLFV